MRFIRSLLFLIIGIAFITPIQHCKAQAFLTNPFGASYWQPNFGFSAGTFFNTKDYLLDFGLGYDEIGYDFTIMINGTFRPYLKKVVFEESDHLYIQAKERIIQFSIDVEKRFNFLEFGNANKLGIYGMAKFGYLWGQYEGFYKNRNQTFSINPGAGFSMQFNNIVRISLGYLHFNSNPYVSSHTVLIRANFYVGSKNNND